MVFKLLLGDHLNRTKKYAQHLWGNGCELLTKNNSKTLLNQQKTSANLFYTSLGDWQSSPDQLLDISTLANEVVVAPFMLQQAVDPWNPSASDAGILSIMALVLDKIYGSAKFENSKFFELTHHANQRHVRTVSEQKTIWAVGCSITQGDGVDPKDRWADRLSDIVGLPVNVIAESGSSIQWAADKILRADIQAGDIVVWAVTQHERFTWYCNDKCHHVHEWYVRNRRGLPQLSIEYIDSLLASDHLLHSAVFFLNQVENFCHKIHADLLMFGVLTSDALNLQMSSKNNFIPYFRFSKKYIDLGTDGLHPGPKEHAHMAQLLSTKLHQLGYI